MIGRRRLPPDWRAPGLILVRLNWLSESALAQMIDIASDVVLIALELLELAAHHEERFCASSTRYRPPADQRRGTVSMLASICRRVLAPGHCAGQTIDFCASLLQEQIDLFELLLSLLQLGPRFSSSRRHRCCSRSVGNLFLWLPRSTPSWKIYHYRELTMVECPASAPSRGGWHRWLPGCDPRHPISEESRSCDSSRSGG